MAHPRVNIRRLKDFALTEIPKDSPLHAVILCEPDELDAMDFALKVKLWLKLARGKLL